MSAFKRHKNIKRNTKMSGPYGNFKVYHPDGEPMFFCSERRYGWYIRKGLARLYKDGIQLLFEPRGKGELPAYLAEDRSNSCVVSGSIDNLTIHHVIPYQYRKYLPIEYKDKNSQDIVVLARDVHDEYEKLADVLKAELIEKYISSEEIEFNERLLQVSKKVRSLAKNGHRMPEDAIYRAELLILEFCYDYSLEIDDILETYPNNYSQLIVERCGYEDFIRLWKNHFYNTMKPKFLPSWWNPNDIIKKKIHDK